MTPCLLGKRLQGLCVFVQTARHIPFVPFQPQLFPLILYLQSSSPQSDQWGSRDWGLCKLAGSCSTTDRCMKSAREKKKEKQAEERLEVSALILKPQHGSSARAQLIAVRLLSPLFRQTPYQASQTGLFQPCAARAAMFLRRCTLTPVSISAALYPFIDACPALIPALICHAIHYPSVCFSGLLNDSSH